MGLEQTNTLLVLDFWQERKCRISPILFFKRFQTLTVFLISVSQVNKLKRDLACMKQELLYKEQGFETLKE